MINTAKKGGIYMLKRMITFSLAMVLLCVLPLTSSAALKSNVDSWKDWNVTFNQEVNHHSGLEHVYIQSDDHTKHPVSVTISADSKKFIVEPEKPYLFGEKYTLVIPQSIKSAQGETLKQQATKNFAVESDYIESIETHFTPFLTNILVNKKSDANVTKVEMVLEGTTIPQNLKRQVNEFSKGMFSLSRGQAFEIHVYDDKRLLEVLYYKVK